MEPLSRHSIELRHEIHPGDLGRVVQLHGEVYAGEYGFNHQFEAYVAYTLGEFASDQVSAGGRLWLAEIDGRLVGSIGIVLRDHDQAQLRWLIVHPNVRGRGLGRRLVAETISYCRDAGCRWIYLWTVSPLVEAARLYLAHGFRLTEETEVRRMWGSMLAEQRYDLNL
jgi:GNAT superfamily N-acetyltransferase